MNQKQTIGNNILIKLDKTNESIKFKDGSEIYLDTSFDPEKHATVTGEVFGLPKKLFYSGKPNLGMPWDTPLEVKMGDRVVLYYLAVVNCFRPESYKAIIEGEDRYIVVTYQNIYAIVRDGQLIPVNGYCLIEPMENPEKIRTKERMEKAGLISLDLNKKSNKDVVYGKVAHCGVPNEEYVDAHHTDNGVDIEVDDIVVLKRISDIPLEYDLHAKIDGGRKYWRIQRRYILGIYESKNMLSSKIDFTPTTKDSYDGKKGSFLRDDEEGIMGSGKVNERWNNIKKNL